jgi:hypothetical protein
MRGFPARRYLAPMARRAHPLLWITGVAGALWLIFPIGFPSYDTRYHLVWGDELAHGMSPDYGAAQPPTSHPLGQLWGAIVSLLDASGASDATVVLAYLALGAIAYLVYRLGALWFDRPIGVVAALIVLTRPPILKYGLRCSPDLPYIALVLAALVIETRRPRAGWPVLALLAVAGLVRPEAWFFSAVYLAYLAFERDPERGRLALRRRADVEGWELAGFVALAVSAPLLWASFDLITTGDPLYSRSATRGRVESLERQTGPVDLVLYGPRRLAEVMEIPGLIAAAAGMALGLALMRRRALIGVFAAVLAGAAFAILASAGFSIISRYTMLASAVLCVFGAAALLGWRLLAADDRWRRRWQLIAATIAVIFVVQAPQQYDYVADVHSYVGEQSEIESDLRQLSNSGAIENDCRPISVPSDRFVPRLAAWLDLPPSAVVITTEQGQPGHGYYLEPATEDAKRHFGTAEVPTHFLRVARNDSFLLYARCG